LTYFVPCPFSVCLVIGAWQKKRHVVDVQMPVVKLLQFPTSDDDRRLAVAVA
jgi:hypothetical protein